MNKWNLRIWIGGYIDQLKSTGFEQKNRHLTHVEIDEVLCLVGYVWTEVTAHYSVPRGIVFLVELLFDVCCNILFNIEFFQGNISAINCVLLHLFIHICMLDNGFSFSCRHFYLNLINIINNFIVNYFLFCHLKNF